MIRKAKAVWHATGRDGVGHLSSDQGCSLVRLICRPKYQTSTKPENDCLLSKALNTTIKPYVKLIP